mmetsp:Transcript_77752/g.225630  ORF Transcript_77752/g.225630 Transcript_77752/m.225630 type:complete len:258 (-) Transcript_77752:51-824(-)
MLSQALLCPHLVHDAPRDADLRHQVFDGLDFALVLLDALGRRHAYTSELHQLLHGPGIDGQEEFLCLRVVVLVADGVLRERNFAQRLAQRRLPLFLLPDGRRNGGQRPPARRRTVHAAGAAPPQLRCVVGLNLRRRIRCNFWQRAILRQLADKCGGWRWRPPAATAQNHVHCENDGQEQHNDRHIFRSVCAELLRQSGELRRQLVEPERCAHPVHRHLHARRILGMQVLRLLDEHLCAPRESVGSLGSHVAAHHDGA